MGFQRRDLPAGQTDYDLYIFGILDFTSIPMVRAGSVIGLAVKLSSSLPAGETATITVEKNGATFGSPFEIIIPSGSDSGQATVDLRSRTFTSGDLIGCVVDTSNNGAWPATVDIIVTVETSPFA